jgi:hypothetical protein
VSLLWGMVNGVECVGFGETDGSFGGGVNGNNELCAAWQVAELMQAIGLAVVGRVAAAVKR